MKTKDVGGENCEEGRVAGARDTQVERERGNERERAYPGVSAGRRSGHPSSGTGRASCVRTGTRRPPTTSAAAVAFSVVTTGVQEGVGETTDRPVLVSEPTRDLTNPYPFTQVRYSSGQR